MTQVATDYLENHGEEQASGPSYFRNTAYPLQNQIFFHNVFEEIAEEALVEDEPPENQSTLKGTTAYVVIRKHENTDPDPFKVRVGPRNVIDTEKVAAIIWRQIAVERGFWLNFFICVKSHITDLLALRYKALIYSRPTFRLIITILYLTGFFVLFIPTISTFLRVTLRTLGM